MFETCLSAIIDEFPKQLRRRRTLVAAVACFIEFLLGLPLITQGGIYILQIIDWYCASFSLMLISFTEVLAVSWVYGADRFYRDIEMMIGYQPNIWWKISWKYITPAAILFIWLFSVITLGPVTYGDVTYPEWAPVLGWCLGISSVIPIPIVMLYKILTTEGTLMERLQKLRKPTKEWGPSLAEYREHYDPVKGALDGAVLLYEKCPVQENSNNHENSTLIERKVPIV